MKKDLEEKVEVTLARFDKAVKESSTRRLLDPTAQRQQQSELEFEPETASERREVDLAEGIAAQLEGGTPTGKPRCRPWDYEGFIARQRTFTPLKWFSKPPSASPPVCARYGWINTARDTLSCECCGAQLRYSEGNQANTSSSSSSSGGDGGAGGADASANAAGGGVDQPASAPPFSSRLKSQHHDLCPWKGNACPQEFLQLPPMVPEDLLTEFVARLRSLEPFITAATLPEVSLPSSFEEHCSGGLSTLAVKTRTVLAQHASSSVSSSSSSSSSSSPSAVNLSGCNKRQRDVGDGDGDGGGGLSTFRDEVLGTAAAIALFGWGSANSACEDAGAFRGAGSPKKAPYRLCCALCNRRLATDNFLTIDVGPRLDANGGMTPSQPAAASVGDSGGGSGRSGKRRRMSGGGTPLKQMDLAMEHRSFCPWAAVHPPEAGEEEKEVGGEGALPLPGWRQPLEALLHFGDPAEQASSEPKEAEDFGDITIDGKAQEALHKVQKILGVLMRY
eukprot:g20658.t2